MKTNAVNNGENPEERFGSPGLYPYLQFGLVQQLCVIPGIFLSLPLPLGFLIHKREMKIFATINHRSSFCYN